MAELTLEQQRALALARARSRAQGPTREAAAELPEKPRGLGERILGGISTLNEGMSFGHAGEGAAAIEAALGDPMTGKFFDYSRPFSERYKSGLQREEGRRKEFGEKNPYLAPAMEIAGALATPVAAAKGGFTLIGKGAGPVSKVALAALEGAGYGGAYGHGKAAPGERAKGAAIGATTGAALGGATSMVGNALLGALSRRAARKAAPTVQALREQSSKLYDLADAQGVVYSPAAWRDMMDNVLRELSDEGISEAQPAILAILRRMRNVPEDVGVTLKGVDIFRKQLGNAFKPNDPSSQYFAMLIRDHLDDFMSEGRNVWFAEGNQKVAGDALREARALWSRMRKGQTLQELTNAAEIQAGRAYSGGNIENALRQQMSKILTSKRLRRGFSQAELDEIEKFVTGGSKALRTVSKLSPVGSGLMTALNLGAAAWNPLMAIPAGVGMVTKGLRDRAAMKGAETLAAMVQSGEIPGQVPQYLLSPEKQAIIQNLMGGYGGGRASKALTGTAP